MARKTTESTDPRHLEGLRQLAQVDPREDPCELCGKELDECICVPLDDPIEDSPILDELSGDFEDYYHD